MLLASYKKLKSCNFYKKNKITFREILGEKYIYIIFTLLFLIKMEIKWDSSFYFFNIKDKYDNNKKMATSVWKIILTQKIKVRCFWYKYIFKIVTILHESVFLFDINM